MEWLISANEGDTKGNEADEFRVGAVEQSHGKKNHGSVRVQLMDLGLMNSDNCVVDQIQPVIAPHDNRGVGEVVCPQRNIGINWQGNNLS